MWIRVRLYDGPRTVLWRVNRYNPYTGEKVFAEKRIVVARRISDGYAVVGAWAAPYLGSLLQRLENYYPDIERPGSLPKPRSYQREVLEELLARSPRRGLVALPTGAGKTVVAAHFVAEVGKPALVVVPTTALVEQWLARLTDWGFRACRYPEACDVTVTTYQATSWIEANAKKYYTLVLDEAHHAPAEKWRKVLEAWIWPAIIALTATPFRDDGNHVYLYELLGWPITKTHRELAAKGYLAPLVLQPVPVNPPEHVTELVEKARTARMYAAPDAPRLNARAKRVLEAAKAEASKSLLSERTIVYTAYRSTAVKLARETDAALIIGGMTGEEVRREIARYEHGRPLVVTSAGMEGLDLPDAEKLVILSRPSRRQTLQLIGRVLRPKERAVVYYLYARGLEGYSWLTRLLEEQDYMYVVRRP